MNVRTSREAGRTVLTILLPQEIDGPTAQQVGSEVLRRTAGVAELAERRLGGGGATAAGRAATSGVGVPAASGRGVTGREFGTSPRMRRFRGASPEAVLVSAPVDMTGEVLSEIGAGRTVIRARHVPVGTASWAAARASASGAAPTSSMTARRAAGRVRGRSVAASPTRFARLASSFAWLDAVELDAPSEGSVAERVSMRSEPVSRRRPFGPEAVHVAAAAAAEETMGAIEERGTASLFERTARAGSASGRSRRPMTGRRLPSGAFAAPAGHERGAAAAERGRQVQPRRMRSGVDTSTTLEAGERPVDHGPDAPAWAQRDMQQGRAGDRHLSIGERVSLKADHSLVNALSRAATPEQLLRIVSDADVTPGQLRRVLPGPAARLVERVVNLESMARQGQRSEARRVLGVRMRGTAPEPDFVRRPVNKAPEAQYLPSAALPAPQAGASRVTHLANKLLKLIHLAEVEKRVQDAKTQVRMSDSEPGEGAGSGPGTASDVKTPNMKALKREVLEAVLKKLKELEERSVEDPNGPAMWW